MRQSLQVIVVCMLLAVAGELRAATISDALGTSHAYWNGSSTDLSGTVWSGLQNTTSK